ncbi:hypothetical protein FIBSPDRAFT_883607 [Athelia psychrophila]|uniref:Uncharacterized protein n=1 Tax=Athelia psychrophila TaxID=1759441 RepID=A0A166U769_9AGAM|nr:hypothetical protein FIBSPDRAFT_883607 [Fibularhizoctonia sp. CBS 109695]
MISEILHSEGGLPNSLLCVNARDDAQLKALVASLFPFLKSRHEALSGFIAEASNEQSHLSQKIKEFYVEKQTSTQALLDVFAKADAATAALGATAKAAREDSARTAWETDHKECLTKLNGETVHTVWRLRPQSKGTKSPSRIITWQDGSLASPPFREGASQRMGTRSLPGSAHGWRFQAVPQRGASDWGGSSRSHNTTEQVGSFLGCHRGQTKLPEGIRGWAR